MNALTIIGKLIGNTLLGAVVLPLLAILFVIVIYMSDSRCGTPGDSGGCEMGLAMVIVGAIPVGAALGFVAGIWQVIRAMRRLSPPPASEASGGEGSGVGG